MICWIKTTWERILSFILNEIPIDGHDWVDTEVHREVHRNVTVTISLCVRCGEQEITWSR